MTAKTRPTTQDGIPGIKTAQTISATMTGTQNSEAVIAHSLGALALGRHNGSAMVSGCGAVMGTTLVE
ncbi:Uncharacterised protein [Mycobacteroides abscessus subsp. abscessus]|nr:Uncharacterised protein [Mycobacteroides abscessus subsp. abscessus]